jgi:hypothetical protein
MRKDGLSMMDISRKLNVGKTTIQRFVAGLSGDGSGDGPEGESDPDTYYAPVFPDESR